MHPSEPEPTASAEVEAVGEGEFEAEPAARVEGDAEFDLAVFEDRFHLRIAFEASRHVAHGRARGPVAGHVARLILALAGLIECLPTLDKAIGAASLEKFSGGTTASQAVLTTLQHCAGCSTIIFSIDADGDDDAEAKRL